MITAKKRLKNVVKQPNIEILIDKKNDANHVLSVIIPDNKVKKNIKSPKTNKNKNVIVESMDADQFKQKILSMFVLVVCEYLQMIEHSVFMSNLDNRLFFSAIGMRMLFHIFQMNLIYTKNIDIILCQKSLYYYLEYLEQMKKTNALHCLNYLDAIQFVYNKTITKNYDRNQKDDNECVHSLISNMAKITQFIFLIMWWENNNINRLLFDKTFLEKLLLSKDIPLLFQFIERVQFDIESFQKPNSTNETEYFNFLNSLMES